MEKEEEVLIRKKVYSNVFKIIMDIILIMILLLIFYYVYSEIETFKELDSDVCRLCEEKTGGVCSDGVGEIKVRSLFNYSYDGLYRFFNGS